MAPSTRLVLLAALVVRAAGLDEAGQMATVAIHRWLFGDNLRNVSGARFPGYEGDAKLLAIVPPSNTTVKAGFRIFKVESVSPAAGTMTMKVWYRLQWNDNRLAWDPSQFAGVGEINVRAATLSDAENNEIWTPDLVPYNAAGQVAASLEPSVASVSSDGMVFWSRQGSLTLLCGFSGLNNFPFDELKCPTDVGGWMLGNDVQRIALLDEGWRFVGLERSRIATYSQWEFVKATASLAIKRYPYSSQEYPLIEYVFFVRRDARTYYMLTLWLPPIFLAVLAFSTLYVSPSAGERLGYGMTIFLAAQFAKSIQQQLMPICKEIVWFDIYIFFHELYYFSTLMTSCITVYLYYSTADSFVPRWLRVALGGQAALDRLLNKQSMSDNERESAVARLYRKLAKGGGDANRLQAAIDQSPTPAAASASPAGEANLAPSPAAHATAPSLARIASGGAFSACGSSASRANSLAAAGETEAASAARGGKPRPAAGASAPPEDATDQLNRKLLFFERLYFLLDSDGDGTVQLDEVSRFLSFADFYLLPGARMQKITDALDLSSLFREADVPSELSLGGEQMGAKPRAEMVEVTRLDFVKLCVENLMDKPLEDLTVAAETYAAAQAVQKKRAQTRWRRVALDIDYYARWLFSSLYLIVLVGMWQLNPGYSPHDDQPQLVDQRYAEEIEYDASGGDMRTLPFAVRHEHLWLLRSLITPMLVLVAVVAWLLLRVRTNRKMLAARWDQLHRMQQNSSAEDDSGRGLGDSDGGDLPDAAAAQGGGARAWASAATRLRSVTDAHFLVDGIKRVVQDQAREAKQAGVLGYEDPLVERSRRHTGAGTRPKARSHEHVVHRGLVGARRNKFESRPPTSTTSDEQRGGGMAMADNI